MKPTRRAWIALYAALAIVTAVRVASTHRVFCEVLDEPVHVAAGMEWLEHGTMSLDPTHPPLERMLSAIPLWLSGIRLSDEPNAIQSGNRILYANDAHEHNLVLARIGNLLLLLLMLAGTAMWGRRYFDEPVPFIAAALVACTPSVLGHAGVATTDIAVAATLPLSVFALDRWLEAPTHRRGALLGIAAGLGLLSKFSFLLFFPLAAIVVLLVRRKMFPLKSIVVPIAIAFLIVWGAYRFSFGRAESLHDGAGYVAELAPGPLKPMAMWIGEHVPIPAPEFVVGAGMVRLHDRSGHTSFLLGRYSENGWWYYFPVVVFFKTPIALLILAAWGTGLLVAMARREQGGGSLQFIFVPLVVLLASMTSHINIGVRHVLPIYPGIAICAAVAIAAIWRESTTLFARASIAALLAWIVIGTSLAHPDYLAWFNEAAGRHPERIAIDSNLDWGQDVFRLRRAVRDLHIRSMTTSIVSNAWLFQNGIPPGPPVRPYRKQTGWIAISETQNVLFNRNGALAWLAWYQPRRIGKSIRLYYVPTGSEAEGTGPLGIASDIETVLLPIAGTVGPQGAPGGARWRVDQTISNRGPKRVEVTLSQCASPPCAFDLAPRQTVRVTGSDPIRPFIDVSVPRAAMSSLVFSTIARRVDKDVPGSDIVVPAVPRSEFRSGVVEIANVPLSRLNRLNLRLYAETGTATSAQVRVSRDDRVLAEAGIPIYTTGYYVLGDFASLFPQVRDQETRATVTIEASTRLWAFITETDAAGRSTLYLPK